MEQSYEQKQIQKVIDAAKNDPVFPKSLVKFKHGDVVTNNLNVSVVQLKEIQKILR